MVKALRFDIINVYSCFGYDTSAKTIYVPSEAYDAYTQSTSYKINTTTSANWAIYKNYIVREEPELDQSGLLNNEIFYTATANLDLSPVGNTLFGANCISNEWDPTTGEGVMTFDGSVTKIGDGAFNGYVFTDIATHLTSITIPNSVEYIGDGAFCDCDGLTSFAIPNSVTTIGPDAFSWCDNLTTVNIGEKVSSIGDKTFFRCVNLTTIYCEATTPPTLVSDVFALCSNIEQVYVPDQSVDLYKAADGWSTYANRMTGYKF